MYLMGRENEGSAALLRREWTRNTQEKQNHKGTYIPFKNRDEKCLDNFESVSKTVALVALRHVGTAGVQIGMAWGWASMAWGWASMYRCTCGNENASRRPTKTSVIKPTCQWRRTAVSKVDRLESPTDASDGCTPTQRVANEFQRPRDTLGCIRIPQNGCTKPNLPGMILCG